MAVLLKHVISYEYHIGYKMRLSYFTQSFILNELLFVRKCHISLDGVVLSKKRSLARRQHLPVDHNFVIWINVVIIELNIVKRCQLKSMKNN